MTNSTISSVWQEGLKSLVVEAEGLLASEQGNTATSLADFFSALKARQQSLSFDPLEAVSLLGTIAGALGLPAAADPMGTGEESEWREKSYWLEIYEWGLGFICQAMEGICAAVCGSDSRLKAECVSPQAVAARIADSVLVPMGVSGPVGQGISALLTLILTRAAGESFCARTARDILDAIDREIEEEHMRKG